VVHTPTLDTQTKSKHWKFRMNGHVESIDISASKIYEDAIARGTINLGDTYRVKIQLIEKVTKSGGFKPDYKILEVFEFKPGQRMALNKLI
jgi:hypothetical protein